MLNNSGRKRKISSDIAQGIVNARRGVAARFENIVNWRDHMKMEGENAFCVFCTCRKLVSLTHLHLVTRDKMKKYEQHTPRAKAKYV